MKKITFLGLLVSSLFLFSSCTNWDYSDPNMPAEVKETHQANLEAYLDMLDSNSEDVEALFGAAFEYQALGDYKNATTYYKKVLEINPNEIVSLNNMANIYEEMKDYKKAAQYIKLLYPLEPTSPEVIKDTVRILLANDEEANAQAALENFARNSDQTDPETARFISELYQSILDYSEAHPE
jgi:tetratricopeptide (TPR) repeat protein